MTTNHTPTTDLARVARLLTDGLQLGRQQKAELAAIVLEAARERDELVAALRQIGNAALSLDIARQIARAALAKVTK